MSFKRIGYVGKPVGLKGMFLLYDTHFNLDVIRSLKYIYIGHGDAPDDVWELENASMQGDRICLQLKTMSSREEVDALKHASVMASVRELGDAAEEEGGSFPEYIGFQVMENKQNIGEVVDVFESAAHPILTIRQKNGNEFLLPLVEEFVLRVNGRRKQIHVALIEGLTDEN